jgi:hypothetical protein
MNRDNPTPARVTRTLSTILVSLLPAAALAQTGAWIQPNPDPFGALLRPIVIAQTTGNVVNAAAVTSR